MKPLFSKSSQPCIWKDPNLFSLIKEGKLVHIVIIPADNYVFAQKPIIGDKVNMDLRVEQILLSWNTNKCRSRLLAYTVVPNEINLLINVQPIPDKADCLCHDFKQEIESLFPFGQVAFCRVLDV